MKYKKGDIVEIKDKVSMFPHTYKPGEEVVIVSVRDNPLPTLPKHYLVANDLGTSYCISEDMLKRVE